MDAYRIQHKTYGFGPYASGAWERPCNCGSEFCAICDDFADLQGFSDYLVDAAEGTRHPTPSYDNMNCWDFAGRIFGFETEEALWEWFEPYRADLEFYGFHVVKYTDVHDFIVGTRQIAFRPSSAAVAV
jgi:hypothetical protein